MSGVKRILALALALVLISVLLSIGAAAVDVPATPGLYFRMAQMDLDAYLADGTRFYTVDDSPYLTSVAGIAGGWSTTPGQFVYVDGQGNTTVLTPEDLTLPAGAYCHILVSQYYSADTVSLSFDEVKNYTVSYEDLGSVTFTAAQPNFGFYSESTVAASDLITSWNYTEANDTVYFAVHDSDSWTFTLTGVYVTNDDTAVVTLDSSGKYAAIQVANPTTASLRLRYNFISLGSLDLQDTISISINDLRSVEPIQTSVLNAAITPAATVNGETVTMTATGLYDHFTNLDTMSIFGSSGGPYTYALWFTEKGSFSFDKDVTFTREYFDSSFNSLGTDIVAVHAGEVVNVADGVYSEINQAEATWSEFAIELDDGSTIMIICEPKPGNYACMPADTPLRDFPGTVIFGSTQPSSQVSYSSAGINVDGQTWLCDVYAIGGESYITARDFASAVGGIAIDYDAASHVVQFTTAGAFDPRSGGAASSSDQSATAVQSSQPLSINGVLVNDIPILNIDAKNFYQISALASHLGLVMFDPNGGSGVMLAAELGADYQLPGCAFAAPAGQTFAAWNVDGAEALPGNTVTITAASTVKAIWQADYSTPEDDPDPGTDPGTDPDPDPDPGTDPGTPDEETAAEAAAAVTVVMTAEVTEGAAETTVAAEIVNEALEAAADTSSKLVFAVESEGAGSVTASLDAEAIQTVADAEVALTLETENGSMTLSAETLSSLAAGEKEVALTVTANEDGTTTIDVTLGGETANVTVKVALPAAEEGKVMAIVYEDGTEEVVKKSLVEDGIACAYLPAGATVKTVDNSKAFGDVGGEWYADAVDFVSSHELFEGMGEGIFAPLEKMTRAMIVTVLYRLESEPETGASIAFSDAAAEQWYSNAVAWAVDAGITNGYDNGNFGVSDNVTREQIATFMYRYVKAIGGDTAADGSLSGFADGGEVSSWAAEAMAWAVGAGLFEGDDTGSLNPDGAASRAEVAALLTRLVKLLVL